MAFSVSSLFRISQPPAFKGGWNVESITAHKTLTNSDACFQFLTPDAAYNVLLPRVSTTDAGRFFVIINKAGDAFNLTAQRYDGTSVAAWEFARQVGIVFFVTDAGAWELACKLEIRAD